MRTSIALIAAVGMAGTLACTNGCSKSAAPAPSTPSSVASATAGASSPLDAAIGDAWTAAKVTPAAPIDDATYLRRVSLDLLGRVPTLDEARAFASDTSADKRAKIVDKLLDDPSHAKHLAMVWDEILLGPVTKANQIDRGAFVRWLELEFSRKTPWDKMVTSLVTASGKTSSGEGRGPEAFLGGVEKAKDEEKAGVNGAANFILHNLKAPGDLAGTVSRDFLGVQIQCAQCHDHKTEKWKQTDFRAFASAFTRVRPNPIEKDKGMMQVFDIQSIDDPPKRLMKDPMYAAIAKESPRALDGTKLGDKGDARADLAAWMTSPSNPWFAKAFVNRVWAQLFGSGFVDPPDDFRDSVPAVAPAVLDQLAKDFTASKFDVDALYREILACRAYATSVEAGEGSARDATFSHNVLVGMSSDQLLDSIFAATGLDQSLEDVKKIDPEQIKLAVRRKVRFVFEDDTESNGDDFDGTVQQALFLMNGGLTSIGSSVVPDDALDHLFDANATDAQIIDELYWRAFNRAPTADEVTKWTAFLDDSSRKFEKRPPPDGPPPAAGKPGKKDKDEKADKDGKEMNDGKDPKDPKSGKPGKDPKADKKKDKAPKNNKKQPTREPLPGRRLASQAKTPKQQAAEDMFWALLNSSEFFFRR